MKFASLLLRQIWLVCTIALSSPLAAQDSNRDLVVTDIEAVGRDLTPGVSTLSMYGILLIAAPERPPGSLLKEILEMHAGLFGSDPRRDSLHRIAIAPWMLRDGVGQEEIDAWTPASETAPFRLLAVVNRPDLRISPAADGAASFGQIRFVYCLVKSASGGSVRDRPCTLFLMSIEIDILSEGNSAEAVGSFFRAWVDLRGHDPATPAYLDGIAALVEALRALRETSVVVNINEIETDLALGKSPALDATWVLRSLVLDPLARRPRARAIESYGDRSWIAAICRKLGKMKPVMDSEMTAIVRDALTKATRNDVTAMLSLSDSEADIYATVQETCPNVGPPWIAPLVDSLTKETCNGCHGVAPGALFTHISPRDVGNESRLSRFLLGSDMTCEATRDCLLPLDRRREELFELMHYLDEMDNIAD